MMISRGGAEHAASRRPGASLRRISDDRDPAARLHVPPARAFVARVRQALLEGYQDELLLACRYAVLRTAGHPKIHIQRMLGVSAGELTRAEQRVTRIAPRLDLGNDD